MPAAHLSGDTMVEGYNSAQAFTPEPTPLRTRKQSGVYRPPHVQQAMQQQRNQQHQLQQQQQQSVASLQQQQQAAYYTYGDYRQMYWTQQLADVYSATSPTGAKKSQVSFGLHLASD